MATTTARSARPIPLTVWPCAQKTAPQQRAGRYLPDCTRHPGKMLPDLARRIIAGYSASGDLVADPMCGVGTTLVEAAALGRRCVGVELEPRWADLAAANLDHILDPTQRRLAEVRQGDARELSQVLADLVGAVDLVATSPPYACTARAIDKPAWLAGGSLCVKETSNYSPDPANLGRARGPAYLDAMEQVYTGCHRLLRPAGLLVIVTKNTRQRGRLLDLAAATTRTVERAGFVYLQHVIALHAGIRDGRLIPRPSLWRLRHLRAARARGEPVHLVAHEDVLVFRTSERGHD